MLPLVDVAQSSKEATVNASLLIIDNVLFVRRGTLAARPASLPAGALYLATDTGNEGWYYSTAPGTWVSLSAQHLNLSGGTTPTAAAAANAGTSPPAPVLDASSNDQRLGLTWGTGTGATAGAQATVTFGATYGSFVVVLIVPRNAATVNLGLYISAAPGSFTINSANAPASSQANTTYSAKAVVVG